MPGVESLLLEHGLIGAVVLALGWASRHLYSRLQEVQDARLADFKEMFAQRQQEIEVMRRAIDALER